MLTCHGRSLPICQLVATRLAEAVVELDEQAQRLLQAGSGSSSVAPCQRAH
jgi:hypothetical protein